ncbi:glycosyltransferase family 2 protein [uncultured Tateyamaria sp.]|uniref:glycosyltransferase family 2 protein n=1 Tax=uncultured Tateyamaria sp. TaxID=455651 RepID=UPI002608C0A9|nr:glycosyltransferase family 2 protein [uncultured Tateyamaria sp.]
MTRWGLTATILAPASDILRFAAYHLEQGAHRLYIFLDEDNAEAFKPLKAHPKIRVQTCDSAHWQKLGCPRPKRHQVRQTYNATHAYNRRAEVDWLIHMDVDEFLVPQQPISEVLAALPANQTSARVRPMELLGGSTTAFKGFVPANSKRQGIVEQIYPNFGMHIRGGFLSHLAGKLFVRSGLPDITVRIHNAFQANVMIPDAAELTQIDLAHCHAKSWEAWRASFDYRLDKGSYRAELKGVKAPEKGGMNLHDLFLAIIADAGEEGLRHFYDEVVGDSPDMRARLDKHGLLREVDLDLDTVAQKHFPDAFV